MSDNIPPELIREILSRLPASTLLKLRCVCKAWRYMIDQDQCFIRSHLDRQLINGGHQLVLFGDNDDGNGNKACFVPVDSLTTNSGGIEEKIFIQAIPSRQINPWNRFDSSAKEGYRVSSCNGILFMYRVVGNTFTSILWNPLTGESRELPPHTITIKKAADSYYFFTKAGFGYDYTHDDYKVVTITQRIDDKKFTSFELETMIYSLKSDSWRRIKDFPYLTLLAPGIYLNGALHWISNMKMKRPAFYTKDMVINGIDLGTEDTFLIQMPRPDETTSTTSLIVFSRLLNVLGGCISLTFFYHSDSRIVLWLMKDYKVERSWTKMFSIAKWDQYIGYWPVIYCYSKSRRIVVLEDMGNWREAQYVCLDLDNNNNMSTIKKITAIGAASLSSLSTFHHESLVRLNNSSTKGSCKRKREELFD